MRYRTAVEQLGRCEEGQVAAAGRMTPLLVAAAVLQSLLLYAYADPNEPGEAAALVCLALTLLPGALRQWSRLKPAFRRASLWVTAAFGGLGMMLGGFLDSALGGALPLCHVAAASVGGQGSFLSWMNGLMLAFCVGGCHWLCPTRQHTRGHHGVCCLGMLGGMVMAGRSLGPALQSSLGPWGGMHLAMVAGMLLGVLLCELGFDALRTVRLGPALSGRSRE